MNLLLWVIIGGILGWLASIIMHTNAQQGIVINIIVGIVGVLLAGWLLTPLFGIGSRDRRGLRRASAHTAPPWLA